MFDVERSVSDGGATGVSPVVHTVESWKVLTL
jgi:hypothetical protein